MTAEPPQSPLTEAVRSLEVRWIFPGPLEAAVTRWFGRFPASTEAREAALVFAHALPGDAEPGPDESRSYAKWLSQRPGADSDTSA
jgi:hypothetical protein